MTTTNTHAIQDVNTIHNWWMNLLLGILLIAFGIWIINTPLESYVALAIVFSISVLASGITEVMFSLGNRRRYEDWGWSLAGGILDLVLGVILILYPAIPVVLLPFFVAFWLMFRGIMAISTSLALRSHKEKAWAWLLAMGIGILLFSFLLFANPILGGISVIIMTALSFITAGAYNIYLAFRLRRLRHLA